jgi:hypothetical protein
VTTGIWTRIFNDFNTKIVAADWSNPIIAVGLSDGASRDISRGYGCIIPVDLTHREECCSGWWDDG